MPEDGGSKKRYAPGLVLGEYLSEEDFERYYFSGGWVFPGWIGFSRWIKEEFSYYPKREMLVGLAKMSRARREGHVWFGVYLWERGRQRESKRLLTHHF